MAYPIIITRQPRHLVTPPTPSMMSKKHSKQTEKQLIEIVNSNNNLNRCGECSSDYPTWASWNLGILLCGKCANCHKKVLSTGGPNDQPISKVKSLTLEVWTDSQIDSLRSIGNRAARQKWNPKKEPFPYDDGDDAPIEAYLRDKYIFGKFRYEPITPADYNGDHGWLTPNSGRSRHSLVLTRKNRSRSNSKPMSRLSHRKLTSFELSQYPSQARDILSLGFTDKDAVVESLILSKGNINEALDILNFDAQINPDLAECPPDLPRRPPTATSAPSEPTPPTTASTGAAGPEWWTGAQATGAAVMQAPQIYQYTDPTTGQISYIDANGQQYIDPSNPQHQSLMMQPTNPQLLARQQTNQNILSLYNQPANASSQAQPQQTAQQGMDQQMQQMMMQQQQQQQLQQQQQQQQMAQQMGSYQQNVALGVQAQNPYYTGQGGYAAVPGYAAAQPAQPYGSTQQYWG